MRNAMNTRQQILAAALTGMVLTLPPDATAAGKAKEKEKAPPAATETASPRGKLRLGLPWRTKEKAEPVPAAETVREQKPARTAAMKPEPAEPAAKEKRGLFRGLLGKRGDSDTAGLEAEPDRKSAEPADDAEGGKRKFWAAPLAAVRKLRERPVAEEAAADKPERPDDWQERFVVQEKSVPFYEFGPSQAGGPDMDLVSGMVVKELRRERGGWAQVQLEGGRTGYIDAAALRPAEKTDFLEPLPPVTQLAAAGPAGTPWLPAAPPPDLPDEAPLMDLDGALDLLPPLEQP